MALDTTGLRFNLFIGDNPATSEVEDFNPITFPQIQDPAITFENVGPGDELLFGATVHLAKQQFRALDEGASLRIAVADYSYGSDELYYRSAAGGGVRFLIDNGVLEPEYSRYEEYLVPVQPVYDEDLGQLRQPTYGELLAIAVPVEHLNGILQSINNRSITDTAWWSMMLTTPTDASLFYKSTAVEGQTVRLEYHGDQDADAYADAVELEYGTDEADPADHPSPNIIGVLYEEPDPEDPEWTIGRFKVTNTGTYEAYGMEARIYATDATIEITDALVGGSGLVKPGETFDHPDDTFRWRSATGRMPLLEIRYNDPAGLHILLTTATVLDLEEDIDYYEEQMILKSRITAAAPETFFYDASQKLTVGYVNPTSQSVQDAWIAVDWQSLMGDILLHEDRQLDLLPGDNYTSFDFKPQDYLSPINIGGRFKALVRVMDHNGALIDSKVAYMTLYPRMADMAVASAPHITLSHSEWENADFARGRDRWFPLTIGNIGNTPLTVNLSSDSVGLTVEGDRVFSLLPGGTRTVTLWMDTAVLPQGYFSGNYIISSNDPESPTLLFPVTAHLYDPEDVISLFPVDGRPWERRLFINGNYPAGTKLYFDHDIPDDPEKVIPVYLYNSDRTVVLGYGPQVSPVDYSLRRTGANDRQIEITLPTAVESGATMRLQFGKELTHQRIFSNPQTLSAYIPYKTYSNASFEVWKRQDPDYDSFNDSTVDGSLWTTSGSVWEASGTLSMGGSYYSSLLETWDNSTTTIWDPKLSDLSSIKYAIDIQIQCYPGHASRFSIVTVSVGEFIVEQWNGEYSPKNLVYTGELCFNRQTNSVELYRDGQFINKFNISNQNTWKVRIRGYGSVYQSNAVNLIKIDWTKVYTTPSAVKLSFGEFDDIAWSVSNPVLLGPADEQVEVQLKSPNLSSYLNEAILSQPNVNGHCTVPIFLDVFYSGTTILTDLILDDQPTTADGNLMAVSVNADSPLLEGSPTSLHLTVRNTGASHSGPLGYSFYLGDPQSGGRLIGTGLHQYGAGPGAEITCSFDWANVDLDVEQTIYGVVDPADNMAETDESDNITSMVVNMQPIPDLHLTCDSAYVQPAVPAMGQASTIHLGIANLGEQPVNDAVFEVFDGENEQVGNLVGSVAVVLSGGQTMEVSLLWIPATAGSHILHARLIAGPGFIDSDLSNNACSFGPVFVSRPVSTSLTIDCGDNGLTDIPYVSGAGYGYLDGAAEVTWGTLSWQSYRYGFGGVVSYRFDDLDPAAAYHLDATFFEGDGAGRTVEVWVDGNYTGQSADLADGLVHRLSVALPHADYATDGSVLVEFRRLGTGDVLVNELSLRQVTRRAIDCGDDGTTDIPYSAASGQGYLNGSPSTAWGTAPAQSVRYGLTGDVRYRFDGLDPTRKYRLLVTLFEGDSVQRTEQVEIDGQVVGALVTLSATPQVVAELVPLAAYASDQSIEVRIHRTDGTQAVVSEITLEEETLPRRSLSDGGVTPVAGDNATVFTYNVTFTDMEGMIPSAVTVAIDGLPHAMSEADPGDTDTRDGKSYVYLESGLDDGLHSFAFSATAGGEAATGDVSTHPGPLVGGAGLPDLAEYGNIPGGDQAHPDQVSYTFQPLEKAVWLGYDVFDIDTEDEVEVLLNGISIGFVPLTAEATWGGPQALLLPPDALRGSDGNQLVFRNNVNQPTGTETWGVRMVSLLARRPEGVTVEDVAGDSGTALLVQWDPSVDDGAGLQNVQSYRVYRALSPIGPFSLVHSLAAGETLWVDDALECETTYWYQVMAFNGLQESAVPLTTAGTPLDNLPPYVLGVSPSDRAAGVPPGTPIIFHLADPGRGIDDTSIDVRVNGAYVNPALSGDAANMTATIFPAAVYAPGEVVTVSLSVADSADPPNELADYSFSFAAGEDTRAPYLFEPQPGDGATGVDANVELSVLIKDDETGVDPASVVMVVNGITIMPVISDDDGDVCLSYDLPAAFQAGQVVTVNVAANDLALVPNHMSDSWSFTVATGDEGPVIVAATPNANPSVLAGETVPFTVTTQDDAGELTTVTWRVDATPVNTGITFNGSGGGDWAAFREIQISGGSSAYTDEWISVALGTLSTTPADYVIYDDFATLDPSWNFDDGGTGNPVPSANGTLNITTSSSDLSEDTDTYSFEYKFVNTSADWVAEVQTVCTNNTSSDGCGLLVSYDDDTWFFVGQSWDAGLNADTVTFRFQVNGSSMVNLPVAVSASTVHVRLQKIGNLVYAFYRLNTTSAWTPLGAAPFFRWNLKVGMAAWDTTTTALNAQFDSFRFVMGNHLPMDTLLTGAQDGFADIRITEQNGAVESLVPLQLIDTNYDDTADTITFPADATAAGVWKTYRLYYGNPQALNFSTTSLPGANNFAEPAPTLGAETPIIGSSYTWSAAGTGDHTIEVEASDGTSSDFREWTATVLAPMPDAPTGLSAEPDDQKMHLSWLASAAANVAGYNVYRDSVQVNAGLVTVASFTDTGLTNGTQHCWTVTAVSPAAAESAPSTQACAAAGDRVPPSPPVGLAVTPGDSSAQLVWYPNWEGDLAGYNVYRKDHSGTTFALINGSLLVSPSLADAGLVNGMAYDWVVSAVDTSGNESGLSGMVTATPAVPPPIAVTIGDAVVYEGDAGTRTAVFAVSLSRAAGALVSMTWSTSAGTATADDDFQSGSGTLEFAASTTLKTISVVVVGDATVEDNETFYVNLANVSGAVMGDSQGMGTILNDDRQVTAAERTALLELYDATGGAGWTDTSNWSDAGGTAFNVPGTECSWYGVVCNEDGSHVVALNLAGNNLTGSIPSVLANLSSLELINLSSNQLSGSIPVGLGSLALLRELDLSMNGGLTGSIPSDLGQLSFLNRLILAGNQLDGFIPAALGNLSALRELDLSSNRLIGSIPIELGQLANLEQLDLGYNLFLDGPIPDEFQNLTNLQLLGLSHTNRNGALPAWIGTLTGLTDLYVDDNHLEGSIPSTLGDLSQLEHLYINGNTFTGSLPANLTDLTSLGGSGSDLRWNGVETADDALRTFLSSKQRQGGDWESSQTIPPEEVTTGRVSGSTVDLEWLPILYTDGPGGYEVHRATQPEGPFTLIGTTDDKTVTAGTAMDLQPLTTYYFMVRTRTEPHDHNANDMVSLDSAVVSVTTIPCGDPDTPVMTAPEYASSGVDYTLYWSDTSPEYRYLLEEATDPAFTDAVSEEITGTDLTLNHTVTQSTTFYYRIMALTNCGGSAYQSAWSDPVQTVVNPDHFPDLDDDGDVDSTDVLLLATHLAGEAVPPGTLLERADMNFDILLDAVDLVLMMQYLVGNI